MRSLVLEAPGKLSWREVPNARVMGAAEAVVRPIVIGRCDLDIGFVRGLVPMPTGAPIGHEVIGEVVDVGQGVAGFTPGDLVVVPAQISCGSCRNCRRGFTGRCQSVPFASSYGMGRAGDFGGAAADLVRVPYADAMLVALPPGADPVTWIGFTDMAQDGYRAVGPQLLERPGARVLVIGGLPAVIGIYAAGLAVACGAGAVDFYDDDPVRLAEAARYGATPIRRGEAEPEGLYEIVVDSSITPVALVEAFKFAEPEGLVTSLGIHFGDTAAAPFMESYHKGVTYRTGRPNCRQHMNVVRDLCCSGAFEPQRVSSSLFDFDDAPEAWAYDGLRTVCARGGLQTAQEVAAVSATAP